MPKCAPVLFKRSLIALAVLSSSACSSLSQVSSFEIGPVGDGKTDSDKPGAGVTRSTLSTTAKLIGLSDFKDRPENQNQQLQLAATQPLATRKATSQKLPEELVPHIKIQESPWSADLRTATASFATSSRPPTKELIPRANLDHEHEKQLPEQNLPYENNHLMHEVVTGDNLWNIAKETTGNALNWDVLAKINNVQSNAKVFPGQHLVIPTSLIKENNLIENETGTSAFQLAAGETLWKFSKRTTGDATNWESIASHNNFTHEQSVTVYPGQTIYVPPSLIDTESEVAETSTTPTDNVTTTATVSIENPTSASAYKLAEGETLWKFSKRTTGDATNWESIASHNNFTHEQSVTVFPGQTIYVPQSLIDTDSEVAVTSTPPANTVTTTVTVSQDSENLSPGSNIAAAMAVASH